MTQALTLRGDTLIARVRRTVESGLERIESSPLAVPSLWRERLIEWTGGHRDEVEDAPHLREAIAWLERAQDAGQGGIARGFSLALVPGLGRRGWQAAYPETTGYIIPTLYAAAWIQDRPFLSMRATRAARWELKIQQPSGAIPAGMVGQGTAPAVFNTGQVIFGWLCALNEIGDDAFGIAAARAATWLEQQLDPDGVWRRGHSPFARVGATLYNSRTAWALLAAGTHLHEPHLLASGARALRPVLAAQQSNGWLPDCCLNDPTRPLTHTLAYAVQGLLEGGVILGDQRMIDAATRLASPLAQAIRADGFLAGRFDSRWRPAASWSCLTGTAQMASVWLRLAEIRNEPSWRSPAEAALHFLKRSQNRSSEDPGLRGGIKGSHPCTGEYGRLQTLSWAAKFFIDALLRHRFDAGSYARQRAAACLTLA